MPQCLEAAPAGSTSALHSTKRAWDAMLLLYGRVGRDISGALGRVDTLPARSTEYGSANRSSPPWLMNSVEQPVGSTSGKRAMYAAMPPIRTACQTPSAPSAPPDAVTEEVALEIQEAGEHPGLQ